MSKLVVLVSLLLIIKEDYYHFEIRDDFDWSLLLGW